MECNYVAKVRNVTCLYRNAGLAYRAKRDREFFNKLVKLVELQTAMIALTDDQETHAFLSEEDELDQDLKIYQIWVDLAGGVQPEILMFCKNMGTKVIARLMEYHYLNN